MPDLRPVMRFLMAAFFFAAGLFHIARPDILTPIVPDWVPYPHLIIVVTGVCEIAGALALLTIRLRRLAGIMLAIYALCVWPANFKHAFDHIVLSPIPNSWWYHAPRLAFQPVIIWWALYSSGVTCWPWSAKR